MYQQDSYLCACMSPVNEIDSRDDGKDDEPEPHEHVDLLVDDVDGKDAESVKVLGGARRARLVEGTLGHLGEHQVHGILPLLGILCGNAPHHQPVRREHASQEGVDKEDLEDDIDHVQDFTEDEFEEVDPEHLGAQVPGVLLEIVGHSLDAVVLHVFGEEPGRLGEGWHPLVSHIIDHARRDQVRYLSSFHLKPTVSVRNHN